MFLKTFKRQAVDPILHFHKALEKVHAATSVNDLSDISFREALQLVEAEVGSLFLVDEEKNEWVLQRASGEYLCQFPGIRRRLDEGILGYVANRKVPLLVEDVRKDSRFRYGNGFSGYRTTSFISVPLTFDGKLIGVLNLTDKTSRRPFSKKDLEWMTLFAKYVALNLERLRMACELKERSEEKRQLETEVALSRKMASIGKLAAGIAHELNNPLDGTLRYLHLSLGHLREGDMVREYLLGVKQGLDRMTHIVKNLLAFSGRQRSPLHPVDVNEVLDNVLSNLIDYSFPGRANVVKAYHPALPLLLDKGIDQIFTNIIKNAFEAMPHGGTLRLATLKNDEEIIVRISDTGCGISKENRPLIFEPFFTTKEMDKGCGLGLAICYEIIRSYEGKIEVESEKNCGTTFHVCFPLKYAVSKEATLRYAG